MDQNRDYVPPPGKGALYVRPLLFGSGPILGLGPAPTYTFAIFAASVGAYFKGGQLTPIDLIVEERFHRAAPGGMGGTKAAGERAAPDFESSSMGPLIHDVTPAAACTLILLRWPGVIVVHAPKTIASVLCSGTEWRVALPRATTLLLNALSNLLTLTLALSLTPRGAPPPAPPAAGNYSPVLVTQLEAKKSGYSDVVYLDAKSDTYLEEVSSCNIFVVKGKSIRTPPLSGTILPGVTRKSVIELARSRGYTVEEEMVSVTEAMEADEVFTTGEAPR